MKTEDTKRLEMAIWNATSKQGVFGCFEVTIGWYGKERVDYMTYDTKSIFRCYEVKVTKADFRSRCHNSFVGHMNYYVLPSDLYEEVKAEIPEHVGVYIERSGFLHSVKKAKRRTVENPDELKDSMIRSLCREVTKQIQSGDPLKIERKNRELSQVKRERDNYYKQYWDLLRKIQEKFGTRWERLSLGDISEGLAAQLEIIAGCPLDYYTERFYKDNDDPNLPDWYFDICAADKYTCGRSEETICACWKRLVAEMEGKEHDSQTDLRAESPRP